MKVYSNAMNNDDTASSKRRKLRSLCSHSSSSDLDNNVMMLSNSPENCSAGEIRSENSVFRCCSDESGEVVKETLNLKDVDLESSTETENSTDTKNKFSGGEMNGTSLSSSLSSDSVETESPHRNKIPIEKVPTQVEIDEFFFEAEERERKRFADKFNYDIVRDVPLEGRYEWIRLKP